MPTLARRGADWRWRNGRLQWRQPKRFVEAAVSVVVLLTICPWRHTRRPQRRRHGARMRAREASNVRIVPGVEPHQVGSRVWRRTAKVHGRPARSVRPGGPDHGVVTTSCISPPSLGIRRAGLACVGISHRGELRCKWHRTRRRGLQTRSARESRVKPPQVRLALRRKGIITTR